MTSTFVEKVADAILYEGYFLYPYRPALKNRQRWTFGGLFPRAFSESHGSGDAWSLQCECLVLGNARTRPSVSVRFLHLMDRTVGEFPEPLAQWPNDDVPDFRPVTALCVGDRQFPAWQEAVERSFTVAEVNLHSLSKNPQRHRFAFPGSRNFEAIRSDSGDIAGVLIREQQAIAGAVHVSAKAVRSEAFQLTVRVFNETPVDDAGEMSRDEALRHSFASTHAILTVDGGEFLSQIDPPDDFQDLAADCRNVGVWPVLVGEEGATNTLLAAPIILYDYPQISPESPGDLFDGTEIDEILSLRIRALTDDEKREVTAVDQRGGQLLARTEALVREELWNLHGTIRHVPPSHSEERHA